MPRAKKVQPFDSTQGKSAKLKVKSVKKPTGLLVPCYSLAGTKVADLALPKEIFGAKINKPLLAQAIRVYQNNLTAHYSNTKTRSEVAGSTRKIRVQKGTGGARHGGIRAPLFVGGGIATGPKYRKVILDLPQKMKKAALISALSDKMAEKEIFGVSGLEKVSGKTKQMSQLLQKMGKKSVLLAVKKTSLELKRAVDNLPKVELLTSSQLNAYNVSFCQTLIFDKDAVKSLDIKKEKQ